MVCREEFVVVVFCPLHNSGLPWGWSRCDRREETNAMRVAFDIYLKGLPFMGNRHGYYLMLVDFDLLGRSQHPGRCIHYSPNLQEKN